MDHARVVLRLHAAVLDVRPGLPRPVLQRRQRRRRPGPGQHGVLAAGHKGRRVADLAVCRLGLLLARPGVSGGLHDGLHGGVRAEARLGYAVFAGVV